MKTKTLTPEIFASYAIAVIVYALALYASLTVGEPYGRNLVRVLGMASLVLVAAGTFRWGRLSGFPVTDEKGTLNGEFLLRNLVMTVLVVVMLTIIAVPVWSLVAWFATVR